MKYKGTKSWDKKNRQKMLESFRNYRKTPAGMFVQRIKRKGSSLTKEEFITWYSKQPKECTYCKIKEIELFNNKLFVLNATTCTLTIDRKDSKGKYELNNMVLCCMRCNCIKSNFFSYEEMLQIAKSFISYKIIH